MTHPRLGNLEPPVFLDASTENSPPVTDVLDVSALLEANVLKMHQQQATSQWIRTWSFALVGFFLGYTSLIDASLTLLSMAFVLIELVLFIVMLKDVEWHRPFWRYRDRARLCETYLLGNLQKEDFRKAYLSVSQPTRVDLIRAAFSIRQIATISTDFMEVYLIIAVAVAFVVRLAVIIVRDFI